MMYASRHEADRVQGGGAVIFGIIMGLVITGLIVFFSFVTEK